MLDYGPSPTVPEVTNAAIMRAAPSSQRFEIYHRRILACPLCNSLRLAFNSSISNFAPRRL